MRILLIHNPKAGNRRHRKKELVTLLRNSGHRVVYQLSKKPGCKKALKKPTDLVLVAGGDGTVAKVARHLLDTDVPLAVLPLGTANNLARALDFTASPQKIIVGLAHGKRRLFDVGIFENSSGKRYFFEAAGGGLLAHNLGFKTRRRDKESNEQKMTRNVSLLRQILVDYPARRWRINLDGKNFSGRYLLWEAMNIRSVGPVLDLAPKAATNDGQLDFVGVRERDRRLFRKQLNARLTGRKTEFPLTVRRFRTLKVTSPATAVHLDGKLRPIKKKRPNNGNSIEIGVRPAALTIWRPASSS